MSKEELIMALSSEKEKSKNKLVLKVSPKGCVQMNGVRKFPITFYKDEWATIFAMREEIEAFIMTHDSELASKG